jgi:glycosyltransferase involved in cell wall biosynthesis
MPRFTVIVPTTAHRETLWYALASIRDQTEADFRLHVIGDGCPDRTADIVGMIGDERIVLHRFPKSVGHGEEYRDQVIRSEDSEFVAYLADDDLWLPDHLEVMAERLGRCDFCHSKLGLVYTDGNIGFRAGDVRNRAVVAMMLGSFPWNVVALGAAAHRRDAYLKLAEGWSPRPEGWWSDLWMWRKWLREPWVRLDASPRITYLQFGQAARPGWPPFARMHESAHWYYRSRMPGFNRWLDDTYRSFLVETARQSGLAAKATDGA